MKGFPLDTRKFYDATLEVHARKKMSITQIEEELKALRGNGYNNAVKGVELALKELQRRDLSLSTCKYR